MRLDLALIRLHHGLSRRRARAAIEKGQVTVGGKVVLQAGWTVDEAAVVHWDPNRPARRQARLSLPLLYQDDALLITDKPAGLLTVPSSAEAVHEDTVLARVQDYVRHLTPRRPYAGVVHRLDRDTSGAVAFALSPAARQALRALFREHRIERVYAALVRGSPAADQGLVDEPIRDSYEGGRRGVARPGERGRAALTRWRIVERFRRSALLEVRLGTGRQHQIRAHLAHVGLPVLGDTAYGDVSTAVPVAVRRQMLHARVLGFAHPFTGAHVRVESPLPEDFRRALATLRRGRGTRDSVK